MDNQTRVIEKLMKDLFKIREEYSHKSDSYIQKVRILVAQFHVTHNYEQMKESYRFHNEHKKLTQTYHKKITNLHEKISQAMSA